MKEKPNNITKVFRIVLLFIIGASLLTNCHHQAEGMPHVRYGSSPIYVEIPVHYALENELFLQEDISVRPTLYPDGKSALESLLNGESDIVSVMSTPVAFHAFRKHGFKIIGAIDHGKYHGAIAKKELIQKTCSSNWSGLKIGVTQYTSGEYFMYSYFAFHEISWDSVDILYGKGPELKESFLQDSIDIMFSWDPYLEETKAASADPVSELGRNQLIPSSWLIVCDSSFLKAHPASVIAFLRATKQGLEKAQTSNKAGIRAHRTILHKEGYPASKVRPEMLDHLGISLDEELVLDLENQAQWLIDMNYVSSSIIPDFSKLVCPGPMRTIDSFRVYLPTYQSCP